MEVLLAHKGEQSFGLRSTDRDGNDNTRTCAFFISVSDPGIAQASVSETHLRIVAVAAGKTKVTVRAQNAGGVLESDFNVTVLPPPPASILVDNVVAGALPQEPGAISGVELTPSQ